MRAVARSLDDGKFSKEEFVAQFAKIASSYPDAETPQYAEEGWEALNDIARHSRLAFELPSRIEHGAALYLGLVNGGLIAEKVHSHANRYVIKPKDPFPGLELVGVYFDVCEDKATVVAHSA